MRWVWGIGIYWEKINGCTLAVGGAEGKSYFEDLDVDGIMIPKLTLNITYDEMM
jgi:hypothetical protein